MRQPMRQPMRQLILDLLPAHPPCLDDFVPGGNAEALAALSCWMNPDGNERFLLLWGESGVGKTHLLQAGAGRYLDARDDPDLAGLTDREADAQDRIAVDNVEALSAEGQIALFNLFNRLRAAGGRLLSSASQAPLHLTLREDLRTRLGWGLVFRLQALSDGEKIAALAAEAESRRLVLPAGALDTLLARAPRDMRSLMGVLAALDRYSLERKRPITLPLLREVLQHPQHPNPAARKEPT